MRSACRAITDSFVRCLTSPRNALAQFIRRKTNGPRGQFRRGHLWSRAEQFGGGYPALHGEPRPSTERHWPPSRLMGAGKFFRGRFCWVDLRCGNHWLTQISPAVGHSNWSIRGTPSAARWIQAAGANALKRKSRTASCGVASGARSATACGGGASSPARARSATIVPNCSARECQQRAKLRFSSRLSRPWLSSTRPSASCASSRHRAVRCSGLNSENSLSMCNSTENFSSTRNAHFQRSLLGN